MKIFNPGLVHTPVTPFKRDHRIDFDSFGRLIEFHLKNGADAIAVPMPAGEDVSLTDEEQRRLLEFAIERINGRVPVIAHASDAGTSLAVARARHAEAAGAAAVVSHPPYFWHPKPEMILEHLERIGSAIRIPFYICNPTVETAGTSLTTEITLQLIKRLDNYVGVVDSSLTWVYMIETISNARNLRPHFQVIPDSAFMVSAAAIGASGAFSPLSGVAPKLVRRLYNLCADQRYTEARKPQEEIAALYHLVKNGRLKGAMRAMGRDCGQPRPPALPLEADEYEKLERELKTMPFLREEPSGW